MSGKVFPQTERFRAAIGLMNNVEDKRFGPLLGRVLAKIHLKEEAPFRPEEEAALEQVLGLSSSERAALLDSIALVFEQTAYLALSPDRLAAELSASGLVPAKSAIFRALWDRDASDVLRRLQRLTLAPLALAESDWRLHLQLAARDDSSRKTPSAFLHMRLSGHTDREDVPLVLQLDHAQLYTLYNNLERIQLQLDGLN